MVIKELYTEKLRPKSLDQLLLPARIRNVFKSGMLEQNYLLSGSPGLGKTSLAKVLASPHNYIEINASDEKSIEVIREKITNFCSTVSIIDGQKTKKVIILDEIDGAGDPFFKALRATVEKFHNVRFIATCNFINKVPDYMQSRFQVINFDFIDKNEENEIKDQYIKRVEAILTKLGISFTPEAIGEFINRNFPDMRSIINKIQAFKLEGITNLTEDTVKKTTWIFTDVWKLITTNKGNTIENYKFLVGNYSTMVDDLLAAMSNEFITYIEENAPTKLHRIPEIIIKVAAYQAQRHQVIDPVVSLLACVFECQMILNS